ncbi:MAG: helix-turn-helix domain-containing protein [Sphingobium sp.]
MTEHPKPHNRNTSPESGTMQARNERHADKIAFSERLSFVINRLSISDATLSRLSGLPKNTISRYRNGESLPEARHLFTVAKVLGVDPEWLITGAGDPARSYDMSRPDGDETRLMDLFAALDSEAKKFILQTASLLWTRPARNVLEKGREEEPLLHESKTEYKGQSKK